MTYRLRWWTNTEKHWKESSYLYETKGAACAAARTIMGLNPNYVKCIIRCDDKYVTGYCRDKFGMPKLIRKPKAVREAARMKEGGDG